MADDKEFLKIYIYFFVKIKKLHISLLQECLNDQKKKSARVEMLK